MNTGPVTVVLLAVNLTVAPAHTGKSAPDTTTSAAVAGGFTVRVTILALAAAFSHLLAPRTVT
ncbi:hypothetical protein D3C85_1026280 [compost metagenome]